MKRSWLIAVFGVACLILWQGSAALADAEGFAVPPPPLSEDYYPCAENCHNDMDVDPTVRELEDEHEDIKLHHAEQFRWCLDCHDADNRDMLRLQSGETIGFDVSYRLCGQCHGSKFNDWKKGIHGKRTGDWNGDKQYLLCAHCHNPHNPTFVLKEDKENFPGVPDGKPMPPPKVPLGDKPGHGAAPAH
jgi:hypothetical protein